MKPRATPRRRDLLTRDLAREKIDRTENEQTFLDDARFDAITEKVIDYMNKTAPEDWSPQQWALFGKLWQDKKQAKKASESKVTKMTTDQLRAALTNTGDPSNS